MRGIISTDTGCAGRRRVEISLFKVDNTHTFPAGGVAVLVASVLLFFFFSTTTIDHS